MKDFSGAEVSELIKQNRFKQLRNWTMFINNKEIGEKGTIQTIVYIYNIR
jgi:hypothetical protein